MIIIVSELLTCAKFQYLYDLTSKFRINEPMTLGYTGGEGSRLLPVDSQSCDYIWKYTYQEQSRKYNDKQDNIDFFKKNLDSLKQDVLDDMVT